MNIDIHCVISTGTVTYLLVGNNWNVFSEGAIFAQQFNQFFKYHASNVVTREERPIEIFLNNYDSVPILAPVNT